jgi:light-independent protochlorophyllide reductase subunit B
MGFEGANVLFDTWVHPLMMGLEEHLLGMFREDFEFHDGAAPSHLGSGHSQRSAEPASQALAMTDPEPVASADTLTAAVLTANGWAPDAEKELKKIPFFVRGKARRNTESFARERGIDPITVETMYEAKAHFSR